MDLGLVGFFLVGLSEFLINFEIKDRVTKNIQIEDGF